MDSSQPLIQNSRNVNIEIPLIGKYDSKLVEPIPLYFPLNPGKIQNNRIKKSGQIILYFSGTVQLTYLPNKLNLYHNFNEIKNLESHNIYIILNINDDKYLTQTKTLPIASTIGEYIIYSKIDAMFQTKVKCGDRINIHIFIYNHLEILQKGVLLSSTSIFHDNKLFKEEYYLAIEYI